MDGSPIACTLSEPALQERRRTILQSIRETAVEIGPIANGYVFSFSANSQILDRLANLVELERKCCPFLTFKIVVEPHHPIVLEITGPPAANALIAELFVSHG